MARIGTIQFVLAVDIEKFRTELDVAQQYLKDFENKGKGALRGIENALGGANFKNFSAGIQAAGFDVAELRKQIVAIGTDNAAAKAFDKLVSSAGMSAAEARKLSEQLKIASRDAEYFAQAAAKALGIRTQSNILAEIKSITSAFQELRSNAAATARDIELARNQLSARVKALASEYKNVKPTTGAAATFQADATAAGNLIPKITGLVAAYASFSTIKDIAQTSIKIDSLEKSFYAIQGSMSGARGEMQYMRDEAQRLGLDFMALTESYKGFSAAAKFAGISQQTTRNIFKSFTEASSVLGLSGERTKLVLMALEQMISKGVVSMEELRRQLGDQLPGAFELGAKAMNMTLQEFNKFVASGKLMTLDFLPKMARTIDEAFGAGLAEAIKTPRAELQRLANTFMFLQDTIGKTGFLAGLAQGAKDLRTALETTAMQQSLNSLGVALGEIVSLLGKAATFAAEYHTPLLALAGGFAASSIAAKLLAPAIMSITGAIKMLQAASSAQSMSGLVSSLTSAGSAATGTAGALATVARFAGPVGLVLGTVGSAVYLLSKRQSEGEVYAQQYATSMSMIASGGDAAKSAIESLRKETEALTQGQLRLENVRLERVLGEYASQLEQFKYAAAKQIPEALMGGFQFEGPFANAIKKFIENGSRDFKTLKDDIANIGSSDASLIPIVDAMSDVIKRLEMAKIRSEDLRDELSKPFIIDVRAQLQNDIDNVIKSGKDAIGKYYKETEQYKKEAIQNNINLMEIAAKNLSGNELEQATAAIKKARSDQADLARKESRGERAATSRDIAENRAANSAEQAYIKARDAAEQLGLKNEELFAQLSGGKNIGVAMQLATNEYEKQIATIDRETNKLLDDADIWRKQGRLTPETKEFIQLAVQENEKRKEELALIKAKTIAIAEQTELKRNLKDAADYYGLTGDLKLQLQAEIDLLNVELLRKQSAEKRAYLEEKIAGLTARLNNNPFYQMSRGLKDFGNDAMDLGKGMEKVFTKAFDGMTDALTDFVMTGKLSFNDLANSIIKDMVRIAIQQSITGPLASGIGSIFGSIGNFFTGGSTLPLGSYDSGARGVIVSGLTGGLSGHAMGGVFTGGNISDYSGGIVAGPTMFNYGKHFSAFARGAGLMGEAGPEAIMPLSRMGNGRLGVETSGMAPVIQINPVVYNETGTQAQAQTEVRPDGNGGFDIITTLTPLVEQKMAQRLAMGQGALGKTMEAKYGLNRAGPTFR